MSILSRGLQGYAAFLFFVLMAALLWGGNRYVLGNTTAATGWPLILGLAFALLVIEIGRRYLVATPNVPSPSETIPWSSRGQHEDDED